MIQNNITIDRQDEAKEALWLEKESHSASKIEQKLVWGWIVNHTFFFLALLSLMASNIPSHNFHIF